MILWFYSFSGGQESQAIFVPGHIDNHMTLFQVRTHTVITGDHCVGSSILNTESSENIKY